MRRKTLAAALLGVTLLTPAGCGDKPAPKPGQQQIEEQNKAQQQADDDERKMQKELRQKK